MSKIKEYKFLIIGILLILSAAVILVEANSKQSKCESISGKVIQFLDEDTKKDCSNVKFMFYFAQAALAAGAAMIVVQFVRRK